MAGSGPQNRILFEWHDLKEIKRKLDEDHLLAEPLRAFLRDVGELAESFAISRAPMHSGQLINKMQFKVQNKPLPLYVVIKTTARNPRNQYRYPRRLEYDRRSRHYSWFFKAITASRAGWGGLMDRAAKGVEAQWAG